MYENLRSVENEHGGRRVGAILLEMLEATGAKNDCHLALSAKV